MKKKVSLIIRHKPARKAAKTQHKIASPLRQTEQCSSAKKYLFSLDEEEETVKNVSLLAQFKSSRPQNDASISKYDASISKWGDSDLKERQRSKWFENCIDNSPAVQRKHMRFQTQYQGRYENELIRRDQQQQKMSYVELTPKMAQIKFISKKNKAQNLSQLQLTSSTQKMQPLQHLASISNKTHCLKTLQLKLKLQKTRVAHPTKTVGVSFFDNSLDQISILGNKTEKLHLLNNKNYDFCLSQSKTADKLKQARENMITNERMQKAEKKKFDIIFVRHKLRKREGLLNRERELLPFPCRQWPSKEICS